MGRPPKLEKNKKRVMCRYIFNGPSLSSVQDTMKAKSSRPVQATWGKGCIGERSKWSILREPSAQKKLSKFNHQSNANKYLSKSHLLETKFQGQLLIYMSFTKNIQLFTVSFDAPMAYGTVFLPFDPTAPDTKSKQHCQDSPQRQPCWEQNTI